MKTYMKSLLSRILTAGLCAAAIFPVSAVTISIEPGQLADRLASATPDSELIITGRADARDLNALRALPTPPETLDLAGVAIADLQADAPIHLGQASFKAGHLPSYILFKAPYKKILLPAKMTAIEAGALAGSQIEEITIPEGVSSIGDYAFYGCHNLKRVNLPYSLLSLGRGAFADCPALVSINIADTRVATLPEDCLAGAQSLRTLDLPAVLNIETRALANSGIESLELPEARNLAPFALADLHNLVYLSVGPNARFDVGTLMNCNSLTTLQGAPENLPDLFAANCYSLTPNGLITQAGSIGKYALANSGASTMIFGQDLISIDENAFKGTVNLSHIDATALDGNIPAVEENTFAGLDPSTVRLKVADHFEEGWQNHPVWGLFDIYSDYLTDVEEIPVANDSAISIRIAAGRLIIDAPKPITAAALYDTAGHMLLDIPAGDNHAEIDVTDLPRGVIIVSVKTADDFKGSKIIL